MMATDLSGHMQVIVQGNAIYHARVLCKEIPDAVRMSCEGNRIRIDVPEADFKITLNPGQRADSRLTFEATFRESGPYGRTWWWSWDREVGVPARSPAIGTVIISEIRDSRRRFGGMPGTGHRPESHHAPGAVVKDDEVPALSAAGL